MSYFFHGQSMKVQNAIIWKELFFFFQTKIKCDK